MVSDVALIIAAIGASGAVFALRQAYRQRQHQIEAMYVQRFWAIYDRFSLAALSKNPPNGQLPEDDEKAIRAYIRLCEDELEVRAEGWVSDTAYMLWKKQFDSRWNCLLSAGYGTVYTQTMDHHTHG